MCIDVKKLGKRDFKWTWDYQSQLVKERQDSKINDTLLLVEHDSVYTMGRTASEKNILIENSGNHIGEIPVIYIDRGGDITFHGPGQLVGYPILFLSDYYNDLHRYLRDLEQVVINVLADLNIIGTRKDGLTGVWVGGEKIAAIGVKVTRWYTMHGFALNINTDLSHYDSIIPCGIKDKKVTSIKKILGREQDFEKISELTIKHFQQLFLSIRK